MILLRALITLALLAAFTLSAATATNDPVRAEIEGRELVAQLLSARPEKNFTNSGILRMWANNKKAGEVSVGFHTFITPTNWQTYYFVSQSNGTSVTVAPLESYLVSFAEGHTNEYRICKSSQPSDPKGFRVLSGDEVFRPFAGSDFWLADLALEFLHWPDQKVHTKDMKQGKLVWVLTSKNPNPKAAYSRVVSWINPESGGIFEAEAFDAKGELLKRFEPKSVEKVNGQYQPKELQIKNVQTKTRTRIEFEFD